MPYLAGTKIDVFLRLVASAPPDRALRRKELPMVKQGENKMKVLMVGPDRSVHGGISGVVNNYYEAGLNRKIDLCYIGTMVEGNKFRKFLKAVNALLLFCLKVPFFQIVHVNVASDSSYYRKSFFIKVAKAFGKKIVIHQHGGDFENFYNKQLNSRGRKSVRKVFSMADAFLVLSPVAKQFFSGIVDGNKIVVFPDAIRIPPRIEKQYGQHKLLFLGRLCKAKGIEELLKAVEELIKEYPDMRLYLGGVWEEQELKALSDAHAAYVEDLGWITGKEKSKFLTECDLFVLPSHFEGQSVSILEAMAYSCAVVASDVGGIPQMIEDGETGILIRPGDAASLKDGLGKALKDKALCARLGVNARRKVEVVFSIEKNMEELLLIYEKILA